MKTNADILIIGGGVIGTGIAYTMAKSGRSVILLEKGEVCQGAGGATDGIIALHTKTPGVRLQMGLASAGMFPELLDDLGNRCEYRENCGGFLTCENEDEYNSVAANIEAECADGNEVCMIDGGTLRKMEPLCAPHLVGAKYARRTSIINTFELIFAYQRRAEDLGAQFLPLTEVTGYIKSDSRVTGVHTNRGDFYGNLVVNCTGAWAGITSRPLGVNIPIQPRRGQFAISEPVEPCVHGAFASAFYIAVKYFPEKMKEMSPLVQRTGNAFGIEQTDSGTMLLTSTRELVGFDKRTTLEGIEAILRTACRMMPKLREMNFIRTFSGFRPYCEDGNSVLGGVDGLDGYMVCAGHEGDGISLSPLVNRLFLQKVNGEKGLFDLEMFSPNRFPQNL